MSWITRDDSYWQELRITCRRRGNGLCEFCEWRRGEQLHHRHYRNWLQELPEDVMWVCDLCHRIIHGLAGFGRMVICKKWSLFDAGDDGVSDGPLWKAYLERRRQEEEKSKWKRPPKIF